MIRHIQLYNPCARSIGRESKSFARTKQLQTTRRILNCFRGRVFTSLFIVVVGRLVGRSSSLDFFSSASHKTFWLGVCYNIPFMHSFYHHFHFMFVFNLCLNKWECFCWFRNGRLCVWVAFLLFLNIFFRFLSLFIFISHNLVSSFTLRVVRIWFWFFHWFACYFCTCVQYNEVDGVSFNNVATNGRVKFIVWPFSWFFFLHLLLPHLLSFLFDCCCCRCC